MALEYLVVSGEGGDRNRVPHDAIYFCYIPIADESRFLSSTIICVIEFVELWVFLSVILLSIVFSTFAPPCEC